MLGGSPLDRRPPATAKTRREERRARRLADRDADRERTRRKATRPPWQDPTAIVTVGALVVGLMLVILLVVRPGSGPGQPSDSGNPFGLIKPTVSFPANLANGRSVGRADAPVTVDVWADYQCPFCGQFARTVEPQIITDLVTKGTVRLVAHDFSFLGARRDPDESTDAAVAARCADRQGKFWDYYEMLFWNQGTTENSGAFAPPRLLAMADLLGLDRAAFSSCLDDPAMVTAVVTETAAGRQAGVNSTPTMFINGSAVVGLKDYPTMASLIAAAAASASPAAGAPSGSAPSSPGASASP
ncbi:MAG: DsbA family protein [Chloroflexota bacterium]|nr:DsbA family protein [Chloroflexota bacterium]